MPIDFVFNKAKLKFNQVRAQYKASQNVTKMAVRGMTEQLVKDVCLMRVSDIGTKTYFKIIGKSDKKINGIQTYVVNSKLSGTYVYSSDYFLIPELNFEFISLHQFETESFDFKRNSV